MVNIINDIKRMNYEGISRKIWPISFHELKGAFRFEFNADTVVLYKLECTKIRYGELGGLFSIVYSYLEWCVVKDNVFKRRI